MKKCILGLVALLVASQLLIMADDTKYEHVFIELNENTSVNDLIKEGVKPECVFGNVITAKVPKSKMGRISAKSIAPARLLKLCTDSARSQAKVDMLHPGVDRPEGYTGKGVVMGMIDCGIDLNHIEFKDEQGNCRIKRAYMPADDTHRGHTPVIDGIELPGQEYVTPEEIEMAGTDSKTDFHGTFTSSIAAGSFMGNKYYGVAPEADLVVCGMPSNYLTDVNVMNSIKYIFNYAEEVGKPAVINFSLGSYDGPHDGTSTIPLLIDQISDNGKICVMAAGNEGNNALYVEKQFKQEDDVLRTFFDDDYIKYESISIWHKGAKPAEVRFVFVDKATKQVTYRSEVLSKSLTKPEGVTINMNDIIDTSKIKMQGEIIYSVRKNEYCDKFGIEIFNNFTLCEGQFMGFEITAEPGTYVQAWNATGKNFFSYGIEGYSNGSFERSFSDIATGNRVISVGAYHSRDSVTRDDGDVIYVKDEGFGELAYFSSFGPDANGIDRPMVVAPGQKVVSAYNNYVDEFPDAWVHKEEIDATMYCWGAHGGTSAATPVVAGIVALWLQEKPDLSPEEVMYVLQKSCVRDKFVESEPHKWGYGKIDAAAGMKVVKELVSGNDRIDADEEQCLILGNDITLLADESVAVFTISGQLVATFTKQGSYSTESWQPGIYIVKTKTSAKKFVR